MSSQRQLVVIGAGISGLVCAYRLKALGIDVALLEQSDRVGGVIRSERVDGYLIERGPNSTQGIEELVSLVEELGLSGELAEGDPKAPAFVYFGGKLHQVPSGPRSFLTSSLLGISGKLRLLSELFVKARQNSEEESVAAFARRRIGRQAAERLVAPFVSGIYAGDAETLSVQAAFPRLVNLETNYGGLFRGMSSKVREARRQRRSASSVVEKAAPSRKRLVSFKPGMDTLPRTLARKLGEDLITECKGILLSRSQDGGANRHFALEYERAGRRESLTCGRVVVAAPAPAAAEIVAPLSNEVSSLLSEVQYAQVAIVYLGYDRERIRHSLKGFGFLAAPSEGLKTLGCVWNSSLFQGRAPEGKVLLTVFAGGARNPSFVKLGDAELISTVHTELASILGIESEPHALGITRIARAIPQYNLGHAGRVRRIDELTGAIRGLHLIGNYLHGVSVGDCAKEADKKAVEIAELVNREAAS